METIVDVLRKFAQKDPHFSQFCFHDFDQGSKQILTLEELYKKANYIAHLLKEMKIPPQSRVVLIFPPGLPFIYAFMGCLMAEMVAVPSAIIQEINNTKTVKNFFEQCDPAIILTTEKINQQFTSFLKMFLPELSIPCMGVDNLDFSTNFNEVVHQNKPDQLAYLQYTSGSTHAPKAVMITHQNVIDNIQMGLEYIDLTHRDIGGVWVPHIHTMGLVGGILAPIYTGFTMNLMSPSHFLKEPLDWMRLLSEEHATYTAATCGSFELCLSTISPEERDTLDLSHLKKVIVGGEHVRKEILEKFADYFAPTGFQMEYFTPAYGMSESTMLICCKAKNQKPHFYEINQNSEGVGTPGGTYVKVCTSMGPISKREKVIIVDPETKKKVQQDTIGEIWVSNNSVGLGYWRNPEATNEFFKARLVDDNTEDCFLRTGDLGFIHDDELYISGRLKEIIIIRGVNHYPDDIEWSSKYAHPFIYEKPAAAFAIEENGSEQLVVLQEVKEEYEHNVNFDEVIAAIRENIVKENHISPYIIALIPPKSLQKTHSGKIQRLKARDTFITQSLNVLAQHKYSKEHHHMILKEEASIQGDIKEEDILQWLIKNTAEEAEIKPEEVEVDKNFDYYGIDSLSSLRILSALHHYLKKNIPVELLTKSQNLKEFSENIYNCIQASPSTTPSKIPVELDLKKIPNATYEFHQFPEFKELKRRFESYKKMGIIIPYFREDEGIINNTTNVHSKPYINYSTYNYLGLSGHPDVSKAAKQAIDLYGTSVSGSRLISGQKPIHRELEEEISRFIGTEASIVLVGGHATNETTIGHLLKPQDLIVCDSLIHNSLYQGSLLSGAKICAFEHNDIKSLEKVLKEQRCNYRRCLILVEGVYSMDGDIAPLPSIIELKKKYKSLLMVDEAHSIGVLGDTGRGVREYFQITPSDVDIWMGTLSKSLASCGGYIAGTSELIEYMKYTVPGFVYAAGISPANCAASLEALKVILREPDRVQRLHKNVNLFHSLAKEAGLDIGLSHEGTAIIPVIIGDLKKCFFLSHTLFERGINVHPITYPVTPKNGDRLRFFLSSEHTPDQIKDTINILREEVINLEFLKVA